ncbi:Maf-like protein [Aquimarina sp. RZ0]|uniref:Maf-like protein n=1 Tax=Aquimarina sp. RZ0 TaxID=2607730 RepID=UPI0011F234B5|nr:Maf-like protein [Aquimarina sp. RZ0]KAA1244709.1 septum formation protein Maf [Aquimarina sp. RZ0]
MLKEVLKDYNLILASGSPRRQQFFKDLGLNFTIRLKEIDEIYPDNLQAEEISDYLAKLKSDAFTSLKSNDILVTSDTIVWHKDKAIGKPKSHAQAKHMIASLSGDTHQVITSVCFKTINTTRIINQKTEVTFKELTQEEITYYVDNFSPLDKAGAYGIQEWIGYIGITHIDGSYFNVMGLPVQLVYDTLIEIVKS